MKIQQAAKWTLTGLALVACAATGAQGRADLGQREYASHCAACHGLNAKGAGPYNEFLKRSAPDLTTMAQRNGGVFPVARTYDLIEGAGAAHGTRDMPIWGQEYRVRAGEYYGDLPYNAEAFVSARILALIEYLNRVQAK